MTVMDELLSKPQSQLCKLSLLADSDKAQGSFQMRRGEKKLTMEKPP